MKSRQLLIFAVPAFISACASVPDYVNPPYDIIERTESVSTVPAIGVPNTVATGDNLYAEHPVVSKRTINVTLNQPARAEMDLGHRLDLPAGQTGRLGKTSNGFPAMCFFNITKSGVGGPAHACVVDVNSDGIFENAMFMNRDRLFPLSTPAGYTSRKSESELVQEEDSKFRREILYQGLSKGTIKLSFREYMNDMARPAFTQDILYDLDADGTAIVVFKGLRMKVLKATGTSIQYLIQQPFATP